MFQSGPGADNPVSNSGTFTTGGPTVLSPLKGWLKKRGDQGLILDLTWKMRYFCQTDDFKLRYSEDAAGNKPKGSISMADVVAVSIRPDIVFGFSIDVPGRCYILQAASDTERNEWIVGLRSRCPRLISAAVQQQPAAMPTQSVAPPPAAGNNRLTVAPQAMRPVQSSVGVTYPNGVTLTAQAPPGLTYGPRAVSGVYAPLRHQVQQAPVQSQQRPLTQQIYPVGPQPQYAAPRVQQQYQQQAAQNMQQQQIYHQNAPSSRYSTYPAPETRPVSPGGGGSGYPPLPPTVDRSILESMPKVSQYMSIFQTITGSQWTFICDYVPMFYLLDERQRNEPWMANFGRIINDNYLQSLANAVSQKCSQNPTNSQALISTITKRTVKVQVTPESVWASLAAHGHASSCRMRTIDGMLILEIRRDLFATTDASRELIDSFDPCFSSGPVSLANHRNLLDTAAERDAIINRISAIVGYGWSCRLECDYAQLGRAADQLQAPLQGRAGEILNNHLKGLEKNIRSSMITQFGAVDQVFQQRLIARVPSGTIRFVVDFQTPNGFTCTYIDSNGALCTSVPVQWLGINTDDTGADLRKNVM